MERVCGLDRKGEAYEADMVTGCGDEWREGVVSMPDNGKGIVSRVRETSCGPWSFEPNDEVYVYVRARRSPLAASCSPLAASCSPLSLSPPPAARDFCSPVATSAGSAVCLFGCLGGAKGLFKGRTEMAGFIDRTTIISHFALLRWARAGRQAFRAGISQVFPLF